MDTDRQDERLAGQLAAKEDVDDGFVVGPSNGQRGRTALGERLIVRAATIDELLSEDFEASPGQKGDADAAARRLAAWCRSCASGDWVQFGRRLARDGWDFPGVLARFASVRRKPSAPVPAWVDDAIWISAALRNWSGVPGAAAAAADQSEPCEFEHLLIPVVEEAEARLWSAIGAPAINKLSDPAWAGMRQSLLCHLSRLCAPSLYRLFDQARKVAGTAGDIAEPKHEVYNQFVAEMKTEGFERLFETNPVLLRLIAMITRQWIDATRELVVRLAADLPAIRHDLLGGVPESRVAWIDAELSDPHNGGRSVRIIVFEDGTRIVYKPKDLRVDAALHALIDRLNRAAPPLEMRAVRTLSRDGYGWSEFIEHTACADRRGFDLYFRRAGAWLALFYCLAASDMHHENIIAAGEHPVPIDTETILQASAEEPETRDPESQAHHAVLKIIANSVMMVGLIPSYQRSPDNKIYATGGLISDWNVKASIRWDHVNTDAMRPARATETGTTTPNLPHVGGDYARFTDHVDAFTSGFEAYASFLARQRGDAAMGSLFREFAGLPVRRVCRPTRFYGMLLQRLQDQHTMDDGVVWSAQADFVSRLADWDKDTDPRWPLSRAERSALLTLNVPYFVMSSDSTTIHDAAGVSVTTEGASGMDRASGLLHSLDEGELSWQVTVIRQNMESFAEPNASSPSRAVSSDRVSTTDEDGAPPTPQTFLAEADKIAAELSRYAIRRGPGAAWMALGWSGDSDTFQLVSLGASLYNGVSGIGLFLAAHAATTGSAQSADLAQAGIAHLRKQLTSRNAARAARSLGVGGGSGLGSIIYALSVMSTCLHDDRLLADAHAVTALVTDDLIAADQQLDIIGGSAGAILGLLRLYRDSRSGDVLARATRCGEHLLRQPRVETEGRRTWSRQGPGAHDLNGMSHGAAGYAYALASLAAATGREEFAHAAAECIAVENASYDPRYHTWPSLNGDGEVFWPSQWCHGAPGIGLARIGMTRLGGVDTTLLTADIANALTAAQLGWPSQQWDTLCCGTLGNIEFFSEAGTTLGRKDLRDLASLRLMSVLCAATARGDYRWSGGDRRVNPGLFRGLAGVGYTALRQVDESLPNVLLWQ